METRQGDNGLLDAQLQARVAQSWSDGFTSGYEQAAEEQQGIGYAAAVQEICETLVLAARRLGRTVAHDVLMQLSVALKADPRGLRDQLLAGGAITTPVTGITAREAEERDENYERR